MDNNIQENQILMYSILTETGFKTEHLKRKLITNVIIRIKKKVTKVQCQSAATGKRRQ